MSKDKAYVIALLGGSTAVVSELLWWIYHQDIEITGLEIWTTTHGYERLCKSIDIFKTMTVDWDQSAGIAIRGMTHLVRQSTQIDNAHVNHWQVVLFSNSEGPLDDIRTTEDASIVESSLYNRIQWLANTLDDDTQIIGSLAGGRKTMSASLQTAFTMQARPQDQLIHILVHPHIENAPDSFKNYFFPTSEWAEQTGVPVDEQLNPYAIPFPRLRTLVQDSTNVELIQGALMRPYQDVWRYLYDPKQEYRLELYPTLNDKYILYVKEGDSYKVAFYLRNPANVKVLQLLIQYPKGLSIQKMAEHLKATENSVEQRIKRLNQMIARIQNAVPQLPILRQMAVTCPTGSRRCFSLSERSAYFEKGHINTQNPRISVESTIEIGI